MSGASGNSRHKHLFKTPVMRTFLFLLLVLSAVCSYPQDMIFTRNHEIIYSEIQDTQFGLISYWKWYLLDDVLQNVPMEDVIKIRYQDGREVIIDSVNREKRGDSLDYSMVYICYESGYDEDQVFPCYINGQYTARLKNHMRLQLKVRSEGMLEILRMNDGNAGPGVHITVAHGNNYGIAIRVPNTQKLAPTDRFKMSVFTGKAGFERYLKTAFNTFKPFKKDDLKLEEDPLKPFIPGRAAK